MINVTFNMFATVVFKVHPLDINTILNMTVKYFSLQSISINDIQKNFDNTIFPPDNYFSSALLDMTNKVATFLSFDFKADMFNVRPLLMGTATNLFDDRGHTLHLYRNGGTTDHDEVVL